MTPDDIGHLDLTPALAKFYRTRIHDLQRRQTSTILKHLESIELSTQERAGLQRTIQKLQGELDASQADVEVLHEAVVRERNAVIELVGENAQLRRAIIPLGVLEADGGRRE